MKLYLTTLFTVLAVLISSSRAFENTTHAALEARDIDDDGFISLSVGVRMKRGETSLEKRSELPQSTPLLLRRNPETGNIEWPGSFSEALSMAKKDLPEMMKSSLRRRARKAMRVVITWYTGHDLLYPSCFPDKDNWAPTDESMVAAVTIEWPGKPKCGSFVRIQHKSNKHKFVVVRIVDTCAGCAAGSAHLDLTKAAFQKLYDEEVGVVEGLKAKVISTPSTCLANWNQAVISRYGPRDPIPYMT